ncbi:NmrA family NAD(P)-binding protein [Granulicella sp. dw_53]|uniref:NmrA family NAD(P)-binding protein n=1 Tax=Granulicella sp. dw_53 TaxID=2719792 RepID=UPI001BD488D3|nr:NmrA family NAD(P)-binding protein [Granulicella sp. dw_53]
MFAITGITGKVGGAVARNLLAQGKRVRAIVRDASKGQPWAVLGCDVVIASIDDTEALTQAFQNTEGVFLMTPPDFDPKPGFPQTIKTAAAIKLAIEAAKPPKLVFLSSVGAQAQEPNLLNNSKITEDMLRTLSVPVTMLRPGWFMENSIWDVDAARAGVIPTFLQPLDHKIPMVATSDIAHTATELLSQTWTGVRIVELEGPQRYSSNDIAAGFSAALGKPVQVAPVPRDTWEDLFRSQGMKNPTPRIRMIDGFNEGWIDFEVGQAKSLKGSTSLETLLRSLVAKQDPTS